MKSLPRLYSIGSLLAILALSGCAQKAERDAGDSRTPSPNYIFTAGEAGYACFRIPAVLATASDNLLAFAEGRKRGCSDTGDIDLVVKRSEDNGKTWSALQVVWDSGENTSGNPAPVLDAQTGTIHLLSTWNRGEDREPQIIDQTAVDTRRIYILSSLDDGLNLVSAQRNHYRCKATQLDLVRNRAGVGDADHAWPPCRPARYSL